MSEPHAPPAQLLAKGKRRVFLVKRRLQLKFILVVVGAVTIAVGLIGFDIYRTIGRDIVRDLMAPDLYGMFQNAALITVVKISFYLMVVAFLALLLSHKMAGPVYRFERSARIVADGDLTHRVHLRAGDELVDLQNEFNNMLATIHKKVSQDAALAARVARRLEDLSKGGLAPDAVQRLAEIKMEVEHIGGGFKL
jgi:signal transduction histidine kinase